ncbi:MAG: GIY-YIG nuclease family protein [Rhodoblastus sp.]
MSTSGHVYVLINPSMPKMVKVGWTSRDPTVRAEELSKATGVATPFIVVFHQFFSDAISAEAYVHASLERKGFRVAGNREFFRAELNDIIREVMAVPIDLAKAEELESEEELSEDIAETIQAEAEAYYLGYGETIRDERKAFELYKQAAKLGSAEAWLALGHIYNFGSEGVSEDKYAATQAYLNAGEKGIFPAFSKAAQIQKELGNYDNYTKLIRKFFEIYADTPTNSHFAVDAGTEAIVYLLNLKFRSSFFFVNTEFDPTSIDVPGCKDILRKHADGVKEAFKLQKKLASKWSSSPTIMSMRKERLDKLNALEGWITR